MKKLRLLVATCALFAPLIAYAQNLPPVVDAGPDQWIFTNELTTLLGGATDPDGHPIATWEWAVENAPIDSTPEVLYPHMPDPRFTSDTAGQHDLSLIASDGALWSDPDYMSVFVADFLGPQADITATPTNGVEPLMVQFDASNSIEAIFDGTSIIDAIGTPWDDGSLGLTFDWNFGDGSFSSEIAPVHSYSTQGNYTAILTVIDSLGQFDEATIDITVNAVPVPPAVWLFGSGLIGIVGFSRRKKT